MLSKQKFSNSTILGKESNILNRMMSLVANDCSATVRLETHHRTESFLSKTRERGGGCYSSKQYEWVFFDINMFYSKSNHLLFIKYDQQKLIFLLFLTFEMNEFWFIRLFSNNFLVFNKQNEIFYLMSLFVDRSIDMSLKTRKSY